METQSYIDLREYLTLEENIIKVVKEFKVIKVNFRYPDSDRTVKEYIILIFGKGLKANQELLHSRIIAQKQHNELPSTKKTYDLIASLVSPGEFIDNVQVIATMMGSDDCNCKEKKKKIMMTRDKQLVNYSTKL
jgi:hypothetical protein